MIRTRLALLPVALLVATSLPSIAHADASAELYHTQPYLYGRFEARIRYAAGDGVVSSFFLWKEGSEVEGTFWNELDFEKIGANCQVQTNALYGNPETVHKGTYSGSELCSAYHDYLFEWTPTYIAWGVDGQEIRRDTGETADAFAQNASGGMTIHFNIWPGDQSFGGNYDPGILPVYQYISWVQYSSYDNGTFNLEWREEFDGGSLPSGWALGDWGSPKGRSTHNPNNVGFVDGIGVLSLTTDAAIGFPSAVPPDGTGSGGANTGGTGSGGADTGGTASGGADTGGTSDGGANTGGSPVEDTGGSAPGGTSGVDTGGEANTGGTSIGGTNVGGEATGGADSGDMSSGGGTSMGGEATGGPETGGTSSGGGTSMGGEATGGPNTGGSFTGGTGPGSSGGISATGGVSADGTATGGGAAIGGGSGGVTGSVTATGGSTASGMGGGNTVGGGVITGGTPGGTGDGDPGASGADVTGGEGSEDSGCACRVGKGGERTGSRSVVGLAGLLLLLLRSRRRRNGGELAIQPTI